jgi:hypothetical protein
VPRLGITTGHQIITVLYYIDIQIPLLAAGYFAVLEEDKFLLFLVSMEKFPVIQLTGNCMQWIENHEEFACRKAGHMK